MALSGIGTQSISNLNRTSHRGPGAPAKESATDGYTGSAAVKLAGRPTFAKSSGHKSHLLTSKAVTMFVTAMTIGSLFIGMAQPAFAAPPQERPAATQVIKQEDIAYQAGQQLHKAGKAVSSQATVVGRQVAQEASKAGKQVGEQAAEVGKKIGDQAAEHGKEIGNKAAEVGKEIGQAGKELGLGVARGATSFWNGLRGK